MTDETLRTELLGLVGQLREQLVYFHELGGDRLSVQASSDIQSASSAESRRAISSLAGDDHNSALARNARASHASPSPPPPNDVTNAGTSETETVRRTMGKRIQTDAIEPPPQETLFGVITPKDELSLPRPGETLADIRADIGDCTRCPLHQGRTHIVHSEGSPQARLMFVGEAPGADEDTQARPFVGRAGQLLNKIIEAIGMKREEVLIGNVNRCRPPQNRTPTPLEAATCKPFLLREISIVQPEVIVVLGNTAMKNLLDTKEGITKVRGQFQDYKGIKVMPTFHPAYLLRDPSKKRETWDDMKKVRDYLDRKVTGDKENRG